MALLRLMPGVRYEDSSEALGEDFGSLIPQVGGQRRHWNSVTVDGLIGNEASGSNRMSSAINLDAIEEVKVLLNTYKAEFGRSGGANIQIVSKSGGADYRGSAYYYARRDAWNATRWENNRSDVAEAGIPLRHLRLQPRRPRGHSGLWSQDDKKLFFFYSLEAPRGQRPPGPIRRYRLPTELERRGDFSQTRDQQGRPDLHPRSAAQPARATSSPAAPGCFPGNIVPAEPHRSPTARRCSNIFPLPNRTDLESTGHNYLRQETADHPRLNHVLRHGLEADRRTPAFFSTLRTVLAPSRPARRSPPVRPTGACTTAPTTSATTRSAAAGTR